MVGVEKEGFEEALGKFEWLQNNWREIEKYATKRALEHFSDLLDVPDDYLVPVEVEQDERFWYGLALEPEPEEKPLEEIGKRLVFIVTEDDEARSDLIKASEYNPWLPKLLPLAPEEGEGFLFVRETAQDEIEIVERKNQDALEKLDMGPIGDMEREVTCQEDIKYNVARAEFGIGMSARKREWRPALNQLFDKEMEVVMEHIKEVILEGEIPEVDVEFESRDPSWLDEHEEFMLKIS